MSDIVLTAGKLTAGAIRVGSVSVVVEPHPCFTYDENRNITGMYPGEPNYYNPWEREYDNGYYDEERGEWVDQMDYETYPVWSVSSDYYNIIDPYALGVGESVFDEMAPYWYDGNYIGIQSISLPNATTIGSSAFYGSNISIGNFPNVTSIGNWAFSQSAFTTIYLNSLTVGQVQQNMNSEYNWFDGVRNNVSVICSDGAVAIQGLQ